MEGVLLKATMARVERSQGEVIWIGMFSLSIGKMVVACCAGMRAVGNGIDFFRSSALDA
jgi:hypothetical protein